ncbi:hypothetical protein EJB05_26499, partial [Eragrostis curvula]
MAAMAGVDMLILLVSSCFVLLQPRRATAIGSVCGYSGNYTANGTYHRNLESLSSSLPGNTSSSAQLFVTATAGGGPDAAHALALCRGDMAGDNNRTGCGACVAGAFRYARQSCPGSKSAAVYDDDCVLGFSDGSGILATSNYQDRSYLFLSWYQQSIPGRDPAAVGAGVRDMLNQTAQLAAARAGRFVTAFMDVSGGGAVRTTLYSLAQCMPDMSAADCLACLQGLVGVLSATTSVLQGGRVLILRCNLRYESTRFFNDDNASMVRITPSSSLAPTTDDSARARRPWFIPLTVAPPVAAVLALLCFVVVYPQRRRTRTRYRKGSARLLRQNKRTNNNNLQQQQGGDEQLDWEMEAELSESSTLMTSWIAQITYLKKTNLHYSRSPL